jgi:uncharacterized protein YceK
MKRTNNCDYFFFLVTMVLTIMTTGCGTNVNRYYGVGYDQIYGGSRADWKEITEQAGPMGHWGRVNGCDTSTGRIFMVICASLDLPWSFALDTCLLPFTIPLYLINSSDPVQTDPEE